MADGLFWGAHKSRGKNPILSPHAVREFVKGYMLNLRVTRVTMGFDLQPGSLAARSAQLFQLHKSYKTNGALAYDRK
eukprot:1140142-Pelagomonas_calceolata.AAC.1